MSKIGKVHHTIHDTINLHFGVLWANTCPKALPRVYRRERYALNGENWPPTIRDMQVAVSRRSSLSTICARLTSFHCVDYVHWTEQHNLTWRLRRRWIAIEMCWSICPLLYHRIDKENVYSTVWEGTSGSIIFNTNVWFSVDFDWIRLPLALAGRRAKYSAVPTLISRRQVF